MNWIWKTTYEAEQEPPQRTWIKGQKRQQEQEKPTDKQIKKYIQEYLHNQIQLRHLIKNKDILSPNGQKRYLKVKERQKELNKILTKNGVKI